MKKINLNTFLQTTLLENTTIEPTESGITFSELICGDNKTYSQLFINYLKSPQKTKIKNKPTKTQLTKDHPELAKKFKLLNQHLTALRIAINEFDRSFIFECLDEDSTSSTKKSHLLLYWILQQFITWKQKPIFNNVEEIKTLLIHFINRVKPEIKSDIRLMALHACAPQQFTCYEDIKKFQLKSSRTFALA